MTGFQGMVGFDISYDFIRRAGIVENHSDIISINWCHVRVWARYKLEFSKIQMFTLSCSHFQSCIFLPSKMYIFSTIAFCLSFYTFFRWNRCVNKLLIGTSYVHICLLIDTLSSMVLLHWSVTDNIYECQFASWKKCCVLNGASLIIELGLPH